MIKSMTGFGRYENHQGDRKFTVEMKSVNHRYFDSNIKMPKNSVFLNLLFEIFSKNIYSVEKLIFLLLMRISQKPMCL